MGTLKERITEDMKDAMRAKEGVRLGAIRMLLAAIKQKEVDERVVLDDAQTTAIVEKLLKQRKDSVAAFEQAARHDLADRERAEIAVLSAYLPAQLDTEQIRAEVTQIAAAYASAQGRSLDQTDMGKLMGAAKSRLAGKADMGEVSATIREILRAACLPAAK